MLNIVMVIFPICSHFEEVDYPLELDIYDLFPEDLRKKLEAPRQKLRDEEGKKLGLETKAKSSSKESDVKMTDVEVSSNGNGESSTVNQPEGASSEKEPHMPGIYDKVIVLTHKGEGVQTLVIMLHGSSKRVANGFNMMITTRACNATHSRQLF